MRSATADANATLWSPGQLFFDEYVEFIAEDGLFEITPKDIRLRKMELDENKRPSERRKIKKLH